MINTPWGSIDPNKMIYKELISLSLKQLKSVQKTKQLDTDYLRRDILGYETVINSNEENCKNFIVFKRKAKESNNKFKDNLEVIRFLKNNNIWVYL